MKNKVRDDTIEAGRVADTVITFVKNTVPFGKRVVEMSTGEKVIMPAENTHAVENTLRNGFSKIDGVNLDGGGSKAVSKAIKIEEISPLLKTEPDTAFFWSGRTNGIGGADRAAEIARAKGGVTLKSTIADKNIYMQEWDFGDPSSIQAWEDASAEYARQVSGEARAVVGK